MCKRERRKRVGDMQRERKCKNRGKGEERQRMRERNVQEVKDQTDVFDVVNDA